MCMNTSTYSDDVGIGGANAQRMHAHYNDVLRRYRKTLIKIVLEDFQPSWEMFVGHLACTACLRSTHRCSSQQPSAIPEVVHGGF